ncbi:hypothetical protein K0M31_004476, partial [Melipona bicolor]
LRRIDPPLDSNLEARTFRIELKDPLISFDPLSKDSEVVGEKDIEADDYEQSRCPARKEEDIVVAEVRD